MRFIENLGEMASELSRRTSSIVSTVIERAQFPLSLQELLENIRRFPSTKLSTILSIMLVCNFGFVVSALYLVGHPTMGLCVVLGSSTSLLHTSLIFLMFRKHPALSRVLESYSSQFLLGTIAGSTQVMSTLTLILSLYFGFSGSRCTAQLVSVGGSLAPSKDYECYMTHLLAMKMASFFGGLLSLCNTLLTYMFFVTGEDLGLSDWSTHQYESLDQVAAATGNTVTTPAIGAGGISSQSYQSTPI